MFVRKSLLSPAGRTTTLAAVAALALTAIVPSAAMAGPRHSHRGGVGAGAAAAAFAGVVGTGLAIAAAQNRQSYYDSYDYGGGGPVYAAPGYYYGGGYGPGPNGYGTTVPYVNGHPIAGW